MGPNLEVVIESRGRRDRELGVISVAAEESELRF